MQRGTFTLLLVCCNLGLLAALGYLWKGRHTASPPPPGARTAKLLLHATNTLRAPSTEHENVPSNPSPFTWRMIAARDYKLYISNLRALGCPELTIQDIIIAAVNRDFAPRESALKARPQDLPFWESQLPPSDKAWAQRQQLRELLRQKRALLEELLGISVPVENTYVVTTERFANFEEALLKVPPHKRDAVRAIQEKAWDEADRIEQFDNNLWEPEDREARKKGFREYWDALGKVLTPDEILDFDLARSSTARKMRGNLAAFEPTEQEFREIFRVQRALEADANSKPGPDFNGRIPDEMLKPILGETRFAEYRRAQDSSFQHLYHAAQRAGLDRQAAIQAHDIQQATLQEQRRIMQDANLSPEQKRAEQQSIHTQATAAIQQIYGPVTVQINSGGFRIEAAQKQ